MFLLMIMFMHMHMLMVMLMLIFRPEAALSPPGAEPELRCLLRHRRRQSAHERARSEAGQVQCHTGS